MGSTIQARQKWNSENYAQVKVSVPKDLAEIFKNKCVKSDITMAQVLKQAMMDFCGQKKTKTKPMPKKPQVGTRQKRRKAIAFALGIVEDARDAEIACLEAIPVNLQNSTGYGDTEKYIEALDEAVMALESIYT